LLAAVAREASYPKLGPIARLCARAALRYQGPVRRGFYLPSGRVISLGRLMLACLYLLAIWLDVSQLAAAPVATYAILVAYVLFAGVVAVLTWNDWWRDTMLAGPAHAVDIALFVVLVYSTEGYTSPFFTFFVFILLSAAIRWGWRATALSAILLTLLYVLTGSLVARSLIASDLQPFLVRTGHLLILSSILIWFGINQWRIGVAGRGEELLAHSPVQDSPLETGLRAAMQALGARFGLLVWKDEAGDEAMVIALRHGDADVSQNPHSMDITLSSPLLYDLPRDRALVRDSGRNLRRKSARALLSQASSLGLRDGLAIPVRAGPGHGVLFLERLPGPSTDLIDLGEQIGADIAAHVQRHALFRAAEESAEARSRLALARDLHDSVVQFLAGAAFRIEAMKRKAAASPLEPELDELKQLMLQEQGELREFIAALRSAARLDSKELASDLQALSSRLGRQWGIRCEFSAETDSVTLPTRLQLDAKHLLREAVANAVRHAGARRVRIKLRATHDRLALDFINDGARYPHAPHDGELPRSMKERVEQAGGTLDITRGMNVTRISVSLPVERSRA